MILTIELTPDFEQQLNLAAASEGQDPAAFARAAVEEKLRNLTSRPADGHSSTADQLSYDRTPAGSEEFEAALDELAALGTDLPAPDPAETYSRETIYADHD